MGRIVVQPRRGPKTVRVERWRTLRLDVTDMRFSFLNPGLRISDILRLGCST